MIQVGIVVIKLVAHQSLICLHTKSDAVKSRLIYLVYNAPDPAGFGTLTPAKCGFRYNRNQVLWKTHIYIPGLRSYSMPCVRCRGLHDFRARLPSPPVRDQRPPPLRLHRR